MSREVIIQRIEKSDLIDAKKELMIDLVNSKKEDDFDKKVDRLYRQFSKSSTFKKHAEKMVVRDDEKLKICNMMLVMSVTLTLFFLKAVLFSSYVVNFSVDAIVGCAAFVFSFFRAILINSPLILAYLVIMNFYKGTPDPHIVLYTSLGVVGSIGGCTVILDIEGVGSCNLWQLWQVYCCPSLRGVLICFLSLYARESLCIC